MTDHITNQEQASWHIYLRLLTYVKPLAFFFGISIVGYLIYSSAAVGLAEMMKYVVNAINEPKPSDQYLLPLGFIIIFFFRGIGSFLGNYFMAFVANQIVHKLRCQLFDQLLCLPSSFFDNQTSGHLISKVTYNVLQVTSAATDALKVLIREGFFVIGLLVYLFYNNWKLSIVLLVIGPVIGILVSFVGKRFRKLSRRIQDSMGDVTHVASEAINGYRVVRIFSGSDYESQRFHSVSDNNRKQTMKMVATGAISTPIIQLIVALALAFLVWLALSEFLSSMTPGGFIAFITAAAMLPKPIRQLSEVHGNIQKGVAAAQSIFEQLDEVPEPDNGNVKKDEINGDIVFSRVSFSYNKKQGSVLKNINLTIKAGQTVAFVGQSGSGKSTLVSLIPRFYCFDNGDILVDGKKIQSYDLKNLRSHISLVSQDVTLFNDTIASNIAYGSLETNNTDKIIRAAEDAHAIEFINKLPNGLQTQVGDDGVLLSGGQRQRLAIARALLKDAPILILDEATSALDTESERHIQKALETVMQGRTTLVIAHRLSTIEKADVIVVLNKGEIIEQGDHQQLLKNNGHYAKLYNLQFKEQNINHKEKQYEKVKEQQNIAADYEQKIVDAWYQNQSWVQYLKPVSSIFEALSRKRRQSYKTNKERVWLSPVPLIVVGNITVGGTGKTPLVKYLVKLLIDNGYSPGIVSRGYGSKAPHYPYKVTNHDSSKIVGDESLVLLQSNVPVVIDANRVNAAKGLLREFPQINVIISDDGLQHYALGRHIEIAVIDGERGLGNGLCLPAGPLREPANRLNEVNYVIINQTANTERASPFVHLEQQQIMAKTHYMYLEPIEWVRLDHKIRIRIDDNEASQQFFTHPVHAFAGIGNPKRFFSTLQRLGLNIEEHSFKDHHNFTIDDLRVTGDQFIIMTEKDAVKCSQILSAHNKSADKNNENYSIERYWYLKVNVVTDQAWIDQLINQVNSYKTDI